MVAANLKAETLGLMDKRSALEAEMNGIIDRLTRPGGPGLSGNLLNSEVSLKFLSFRYLYSIFQLWKIRDSVFDVRLILICRGFLGRTLTSQLCERNGVVLLVCLNITC